MSQGRASLWRGMLQLFTGNAAMAVGNLITLVIVARWGGPVAVGLYTLALAITAPVHTFLGLKLRQVLVTDRVDVVNISPYFVLRLVTSLLSLGIALILAAWQGDMTVALTVAAVALYRLIDNLYDLSVGAFQRVERMSNVAQSMTVKAIINPVAFALGIATLGTVAGAVMLQTLAVAVQMSYVFNRGTQENIYTWQRGGLRASVTSLFFISWPLGLAVGFGSITTNAPRVLLEAFVDERALGLFGAAAYTLVAASLVANSLSQAATPRLAQLHSEGENEEFKRVWRNLVIGGVLLGLCSVLLVWLLGERILGLIFGPSFSDAALVLVILTLAATFQYPAAFVGTAINAVRAFNVQAPLNAAVAVITVLCSLYLIPSYGVNGAATGVLVGQIAYLTAYVGLARCVVYPRLVNGKRED